MAKRTHSGLVHGYSRIDKMNCNDRKPGEIWQWEYTAGPTLVIVIENKDDSYDQNSIVWFIKAGEYGRISFRPFYDQYWTFVV